MSIRYSLIKDSHSLMKPPPDGCEICNNNKSTKINSCFSVYETDLPKEKTFTKLKTFKETDSYIVKDYIIYPHDHDIRMHEMDVSLLSSVFFFIKKKMLELRKNKKIKYLCFYVDSKDDGHLIFRVIGLSSFPSHLHTKVFGLSSYEFYLSNGGCWVCDLLETEESDDDRVLLTDDNFITLSSFGARYPFELMLVPRAHISHFEDLSTKAIVDMSTMLLDISYRFKKELNEDNLMLVFSGFPGSESFYNEEDTCKFSHWHMDIIPRLFSVSALSLSTCIYENWCSSEMAIDVLNGRQI